MTKLLPLLAMLLFFTACAGQENKKDPVNNSTGDMNKNFIAPTGQEHKKNPVKNSIGNMNKNFIIGDYMIVPKTKEVRAYTMIGGVNWDGYTFRKDSTINYDHTTLLALGDRIFFKEHFPFQFDLNKLKIIQRDETYFLCRDDNSIYYTSRRLQTMKADISGYSAISDFIYKSKKDGTLFFLNIDQYKLTAIGIDVDENSLTHVLDNYYYDKNGLYFFGGHSKKNVKGYYDDYTEKSEKLVGAQNVVPVIAQNYFSFNGEVFARRSGNKITKLSIDINKTIEINMGADESFITDGKTVYSNDYDEDTRDQKGYYGIWYPALHAGVNLQKIYSPLLHFMKEGNSVVFNKHNPNIFPGLIAVIDHQNYLLTDKKKIKLEKMLFYHPETKTTEIFDEKHLKIYAAERFIQYKNVLYFDGIPVETSKLNMADLREIKNSNYLTDGKSLFYLGDIGGYSSIEKDGIQYAVFDEKILENTYTKELSAINPNLLSDGKTLVSRASKIIIKDLALDVKIVK